MATKKQAAKTPNRIARWQSTGPPEDVGPAEQIANEILAGRRDLLPSVDRIMTADLGSEGTLKAIGLFRDALNEPGDVHRDPRVAIAASVTPGNG